MDPIQIVIDALKSPLERDPWSHEMLALWVPIAAYWVYSLTFHMLMTAQVPFFEKYRIHTSMELQQRNRVSVPRVLVMVSIQQVLQVILGTLVLHQVPADVKEAQQAQTLATLVSLASQCTGDIRHAIVLAKATYWVLLPMAQFFGAMVLLDTHQYFLHRLFHVNKFLYKHIHSHHHRLYVPYAFGALYNHPVEGFMLDSVGAALASEVTGMTALMSTVFFTFSTLKTVDDHCGYALPWDPLQYIFGNNVKYHDIHHQSFGIKTNFSQPFFTFWDKLLGTDFHDRKNQKVANASSKSE